ncbi:hypothetical protein [Phytohabitans aurantiacus]|uniref:Uncharacterized protein n=1 Tax=Phytohabitans aurantiacus TaxID=3016789 RepID=A0ABQ5RBI9_9ACTN|nr:hypothetical protein [Phytohabitans aurantiacus]GLI03778.1 hypothetical protein Pa4123_90580 [Phytohabitans aurantiacus]
MDPRYLAEDALLGMLFPFWQLVIAAFVVVTLVLSVRRLAQRGRSRMMTGMLISGGVVIGLAVIGTLLS